MVLAQQPLIPPKCRHGRPPAADESHPALGATVSGRARIINVSNRLPVTVGKEISKSSGGLVAALEGLVGGRSELTWVGWPGAFVPVERRPHVDRVLQAAHGCVPVFLSEQQAHGHYEGLSNSSIWPLLHYLPSYFRYDPRWWGEYREVNQMFADRVLEIAGEDDLVWVHDYQLMLLPGMVKAARPSLRVGFFLHTPFPSYEVFRCHPNCEELAEGLLGADLVGFHTFGYLRHFRSAVLRLLGIDSEITVIRRAGHETLLGVYPIGINAPRFLQQLKDPTHPARLAHFARNFDNRRIVLSVERLDYTKGIVHRLRAIEVFLAGCTEAERERLKFIFISVPSRGEIEQYQHLRDEVEGLVGRLNGKYATLHNSPIHFIHGSVDFEDLCAMYALAEVCVVTPLIDGMNLVAKEYVACQREQPGTLVLSEFAGAAEELFNALIVNPYDAWAVAACIRRALEMPEPERRRRMTPMRRRVMRMDASTWAASFMKDLAQRPAPAGTAVEAESPVLEQARQRIVGILRGGGRVAFFLDYDGTLREIEDDPAAARPNDAVRRLLDHLRQANNLDVTIISGRTPEDLEGFLGGYGFGLIAEHGASMRRPGHDQWEQLDANINYGWKDEVMKLLRLYEDSTPGSHIEEKRTSLVWHYRRADPEFGSWKARELVEQLAAVTANDPLLVQHGKKIVEVTASMVSKGFAVVRSVRESPVPYDLVLAAGDDSTDETMFRAEVPGLLSIKVGEGQTSARLRITTPAAFRSFLHKLLAAAFNARRD